MNGIILINKEKGFTSQDAITIVKKTLRVKKTGHAGTLDPSATGLLVVMVNNATKLSSYLMEDTKEYVAEILIGQATSTLDADGEVILEKKVDEILNIDNVLKSFQGISEQIPPMYSAIKQDGVKLYELARQGIEVERKSRQIEIFEIERISEVEYSDGLCKFSFRALVSKGTYIRTLCEDIGKKMNYPAHLFNLCRTKIGSLDLSSAYTIKDIREGKYTLINMREALMKFPLIKVDEQLSKLILNGVILSPNQVKSDEDIVVFEYNDEVIAIYKKQNGKYRVDKVWN